MMSKTQLGYDPTDTDTVAASDTVGSYLLAGTDGDEISSGDGDSDDVANTFEGIDTRSFLFGYDSSGDNWDRLKQTAGALHVLADLDVDFDYVHEEDSAHSSGHLGAYVLAVRADARPTDANTSADGDYASFFINNSGELYVHDTDANASLDAIESDADDIRVELLDQGTTLDSIESEIQSLTHAEDTAHSSGHFGTMPLGVRNDTRSSLSDTDGDYTPFQMTANGDLRVRDDDLITTIDNGVDVNLQDGSGTDIDSYAGCLRVTDLANGALLNTQKDVTTTSGALLASEQSNRKYLYVQNLGNKHAYIGASGVTTANGIRMQPSTIAEFRFGSAISLHAVATAGTQDFRILEASA